MSDLDNDGWANRETNWITLGVVVLLVLAFLPSPWDTISYLFLIGGWVIGWAVPKSFRFFLAGWRLMNIETRELTAVDEMRLKSWKSCMTRVDEQEVDKKAEESK